MTLAPRTPIVARLSDATAERVRQNHEARLGDIERELVAAQPGVGAYFGRRVFTASSIYVPTPGTKRVILRMTGAGGGGGGAAGGSLAAAGGSASSGVYLEKAIASNGDDLSGGAVTIGAGGAGGSSSGGAGGGGGDSSASIGGTTYLAKGGGGGAGMANAATVAMAAGGGNTSGSSSGDAVAQQCGGPGIRLSGTFAFSGPGGSTPLGGGAAASFSIPQAGFPATGPGGGGGGGVATTVGEAGQPGFAGLVLIDEFGG